jgi:acetyl esterase/lipase
MISHIRLPKLSLLLAAAVLQAPSLRANETPFLDRIVAEEAIMVTSDLWYGNGAMDPTARLFLDVYEPVSPLLPTQRPALVYIHGGAFNTGDKADQPAPRFIYEFAARGYVVFSINYTLDGTVTSATLDAAEAIRWVRNNAETYQVDPSRIVVGGHSAGGATSLNIGALGDADLAGPGAEVAGVLSSAGGDFVDLNQLDLNDPPIFIINGTADSLSPVASARNLVAHLDRLGNAGDGSAFPYRYMEVEGAGHGFVPGFGLGITPPPFLSPLDEFMGWGNTEIDGKTVERHCFEFFYDHLALGALAASASWAGFEVTAEGWVDTGAWMGWLYVGSAPWVWNLHLETWMYLPEESVREKGAWAYVLRN